MDTLHLENDADEARNELDVLDRYTAEEGLYMPLGRADGSVEQSTAAARRQPALPGFIVRKLFAKGDITGRQVVIEACRAELDWTKADRRRLDAPRVPGGTYLLQDTNAAAFEFPHELAAAVVLNVWGHLHPNETRIVACWTRMHAQRREGWTDRARGSADDLRWHLAERRKLKPIFNRAVTAYRAERALVDAELQALGNIEERDLMRSGTVVL